MTYQSLSGECAVLPSYRFARGVYHHTIEESLLKDFWHELETGVFVDIGANSPHNAVSAPLLQLGWTGLAVEPLPEKAKSLLDAGWPLVEQVALTSPTKTQSGIGVLYLAGGQDGVHSSLEPSGIDANSPRAGEIQVPLTTLGTVLQMHNLKRINLLSIDTEGTEIDILRGLDFSAIDIGLILVEDWQRDSKLHHFLKGHGFRIVCRTGFNSWYVPNDSCIKTSLFGRLNLWKKIYLSSHIKRVRHRFSQIKLGLA